MFIEALFHCDLMRLEICPLVTQLCHLVSNSCAAFSRWRRCADLPRPLLTGMWASHPRPPWVLVPGLSWCPPAGALTTEKASVDLPRSRACDFHVDTIVNDL